MNWLANRLSKLNVAWGVIVVTVLLSGVGLFLLGQVEHEDDVLAFLPQDNPDVEVFNDINENFGSLDLALVGIQADDIFDADFLQRLQRTTQDLKDTRGLDHVLSLANVIDFTPDLERGGVVTAPLVPEIPKTPEDWQQLRDKVMSREHVVGNLVADNGRGVLIYCYLAYGSDPQAMAVSIRKVVEHAFPAHEKFWGWGPFISTYIYNATQRDIRRLTPWAVLAIVIILMVTFRDIFGVCLVLLSTGMGILMSLGLMSVLGVRFNIVLGSMPVILFAVGSAYGIHVLTRYYALAQQHDTKTSLTRTLVRVGPTVLAAGLTTAAGLLSFVLMDIRPLRTFGLYTALGIVATLVLSLTFIPAVIRVSRLSRRQTSSSILRRWMVNLTVFAQRRRMVVGALLLLVAAGSVSLISQVNTSMDMTAFFSEDSPPGRADKFLGTHFGGAQYIQIHARGDMNDPHVLRELQRLSDQIALLGHVTSVNQVAKVVAMSNEAMAGQQRVPDTEAQVRTQYSFLAHDPAMTQLVTPDRKQALVHIKVDSSRAEVVQALLGRVEAIVDREPITRYAVTGSGAAVDARRRELASFRILALARNFGVGLGEGDIDRLRATIGKTEVKADAGRIKERLIQFMRSDECAVDFQAEDAPPCLDIAGAVVALGPGFSEQALATEIARVTGKPMDDALVDDLAFSVAAPLEQMWREQRAEQRAERLVASLGIEPPAGDRGRRFLAGTATALLDLENPTAMVPVPADVTGQAIALKVTGLPVMHRGLSVSATRNQLRSLIFALVLVVMIMALMFRSLFSGLLVAAPIILTLLVIYGGMGLLGVHLDIGTAMLASLILGAGVDYAVHLTSAWRAHDDEPLAAAAARAADHRGPAIWTNAVMVFVGFFVLTLGEARPLQNVGSLTAAAMLVAALATFLTIPVLARKRRYRRDIGEALESSEAVKAVLGNATPR